MSLNNTPAEIMQALLVSQSSIVFQNPPTATAWPLFVSTLPDLPNEAACVYDTEGVVMARLLTSGRSLENYGLQIKVRSLTYPLAYTTLSVVSRFLDKVNRPVVAIAGNSYTVDTVRKTSPIISMGQDEKRRSVCALNVLMMLIEAP